MKKIFKYYCLATLFPLLFVSLIAVILILCHIIKNKVDIFDRYIFSNDDFLIIWVVVVIISLFICILSLTILLNTKEKIQKNIYWSTATWFFFPGIVFVRLWYVYFFAGMISDFTNYTVSLIVLSVSHLLGLGYSFYKFRKDSTSIIVKFGEA